ncbi:putative protein arginine N-methyltransferase 6.1 [Armadillidium nasatum]|uniref:Protein arginine N-methyltransferase 6 n=1 Tax=Armadillidium nasatum TaxID=96803 RepID=A0A5N5SX42_9CRUS|nr:putative protein arginine N-methyltransferase 6.1 [Armadillidium nasatum]
MSQISINERNTPEQEIGIMKRKISENGTEVVSNGTTKKHKNDVEYFLSYADVELHRTMIEDQKRTNTYRDAIMKGAEKWIKGKVVADVGCGTGILSMFCAQAGASKVYAIEASDIGLHAKKLVEANNFNDVITVLIGKAEDLELPEKVDVIVSEWMGYMLLYETMLPSVLHVRDRYLKSGGKMFPERAVLHMALGETQWITKYEESAFDFWVSLQHLYALDMSILADHAVTKYKDTVHVHMVAQEDIMSFPTVVCDLDLYSVKAEDLAEITHEFSLSSMGNRCLNSLVLWFDVMFPEGVKLSTSPDEEDTHWQNTVLTLPDCRVKQDSLVKGTIKISQDDSYYRHLKLELEYSVDNQEMIRRHFKMDDNCVESDS